MSPFSLMSHAELLAGQCRRMSEDDALSDEAVAAQLQALPHWRHQSGALWRSYTFANYYQVMAFVNAIAWIIHREDHHPELTLGYDHVDVAFSTHSARGISMNDFICAAKLDAVYGS